MFHTEAYFISIVKLWLMPSILRWSRRLEHYSFKTEEALIYVYV